MREQLSGQANIPVTGRWQRRMKHDGRFAAGTLSRHLDRVCVRRLSGDADSEQVALTPAWRPVFDAGDFPPNTPPDE
jgi:hypothetical protein